MPWTSSFEVAPARTARSRVEDVYHIIRDRILFGVVQPGTRLHLEDLAKEIGVSLTVVREAVTRLASEELVTASPQQGFRVRALWIPICLT